MPLIPQCPHARTDPGMCPWCMGINSPAQVADWPVSVPTFRFDGPIDNPRSWVVETKKSARPSWDIYFLRMAYLITTRATCDRKHVGAVLVDASHRIIATGYNGSPAGTAHCDDAGHELKDMGGRPSCVRTLHAESNALDYAGSKARGGTLYTTVTPCYDCAKRIVNAGIVRVLWHEHYESRYGASGTVTDYLRDHGIDVRGPSAATLDVESFKVLVEQLDVARSLNNG